MNLHPKPVATLLILGAALLTNSATFAQTTILDTKINQVTLYGDGTFSIEFDLLNPIPEPGCDQWRDLRIPDTHPQAKKIYASAMTAYSLQSLVSFRANGCLDGHATLTSDGTSYFKVK